jgi:excisionase family DNA binding protein
MFGVTVTTLSRWARSGVLPSVPTLGGQRRYRRADVKALLEERAMDPEREAMEYDAVRLYRQGWSIRQVARRFECDYGVMRRILVRHSALRGRR